MVFGFGGAAFASWRVSSSSERGFAEGRCLGFVIDGIFGAAGTGAFTGVTIGAMSAARVCLGAFATGGAFSIFSPGLRSSTRKMTLFSSRTSSPARRRSASVSVCVDITPSRNSMLGNSVTSIGIDCGSPQTFLISCAILPAVNTGEYAWRKRSRSVAKSPAL